MVNRRYRDDVGDIATEDNLGTKIKILRIKAKIDQEELADRAGISVNYLSQIESNKKVPSLKCLFEIAKKGLNINPIILIREDSLFKELAEMLRNQGLQVDQLFDRCDYTHQEQ